MKLLVVSSITALVSCAALASDVPLFTSPAKIGIPPQNLNAVAVEVQREFLNAALQRIVHMRSFADAKERLVMPPAESMERFAVEPGESNDRKQPNQGPQSNARSHPSADD